MTVAGSLKIGTLLLQAGIVTEEDLADSVQVAKRMRLPLGRVLVGTGFLSDEILNASLSAQSLIRDSIVPHEVGVKALKAVNKRGITFEDALSEYGLHSDQLEFTTKLGQLLVDSGMISVLQRNEGLQTALAAGLPIGRVLVLRRALSSRHIYAALSAQVMIRAGKITREQAVETLTISKINECSFQATLKEKGYVQPTVSTRIMLGELLIISNQITEIEFITALENSLIDDVPLGKVLIEGGLITQAKLDRTLEAQSKVADGLLTAVEAADHLQRDQYDVDVTTEMPVAFADLSNAGELNFGVPQLLVLGRVITHHQASSAHAKSLATGLTVEQVLLARDQIDSKIIAAVTRCIELYQLNSITAEEAILSLHTWLSSRGDQIDEVVARVAQRDLVDVGI